MVNAEEKAVRDTVDVLEDWGTPFIEGVTVTEAGKTIPEFGCKVFELVVELTSVHPTWLQL